MSLFAIDPEKVTEPPDPGSPPPLPAQMPSLVSSGTDTWTGPGTGDQDDPSWLFPGGWHEIPLPTEEGETRVVNFRFECYRGPYGNLPQTTGEGYDIPSP